MRLPAALLLLAACRSDGGSGDLVHVHVQNGEQSAPGVRVYAHSATTGEILGEDDTDAVGDAYVGIETDTLITADFGERLLTAPAPLADETLELRGPALPPPALVVGTVTVDAAPLPGATYYEVDVGCVTLKVTSLPDSFDVTACSQGQDRNLDVLVRGCHDVGGTKVLDGYFAARVPLTNGVASLTGAWLTTGTPMSTITPGADVQYEFFVGGNPYEGAPIVDNTMFVYEGLEPVESTYVRAEIPGHLYELHGSGVYVPTIGFAVPAPESITHDDLAFAWEGTATGASYVALSLDTDEVTWDVVMTPRDAVVLPALARVSTGTATVRYLGVPHAIEYFQTTQLVSRQPTSEVQSGFLSAPL